jgi:hypothetical protein
MRKTRKLMPMPRLKAVYMISEVQYHASCSVHMAASEYGCFICNIVSMNYMLWNLATHLAKIQNITSHLASYYADVLKSFTKRELALITVVNERQQKAM